MKVVETDLGEYILQINDYEPPSHLIGPALHKSKEEVAELFHRKHGTALKSEIEELCLEARGVLRQHYLTADMGISGGNFFVAESGSVVLVTNEGNATLTTTLPKVHVAISGIEKIVPTLEDVATLMRLLPRSSTGQSISNYVDILTGPKGEGEFHGAEHMYFILVDSGRTGVLASEVREALRCIRCGACMNHCPVYQNIGGHSYGWVYPGPIGSILTPMYIGLELSQDLPAASTMCNQCGVVCPVRIPLPDLQRKLREQAFARGLRPWYERAGLRLWAWAAKRPALYGLGCRIGVRVLKAMADRDGLIHKLPVASGWTDERDMPAPAGKTFRELYRERSAGAAHRAPK
jgi:L-lactate dehydrogenase complex protein LldF